MTKTELKSEEVIASTIPQILEELKRANKLRALSIGIAISESPLNAHSQFQAVMNAKLGILEDIMKGI